MGNQTSTTVPQFPPEDDTGLRGEWEYLPDHKPYLPEWTDPEWSPDFEYWSTGLFRRRVYRGTGIVLRPAILPSDEDKNPTEFARRFGIHPYRDLSAGQEQPAVGRSMMTPRFGPRLEVADVGPEPRTYESTWTEDESWQSYVWGGPTTRELIASGAYEPSNRLSDPALEGALHPLLTRDRWINPGQVLHPSFVKQNINWKFRNLEGVYNADDDRVWAILEPALRLVGRVISSNHPFWNAMLSIYNIRPVPPEVDGRTDEVKQQAGAPLQSVWLDEDRPGMYTAASELRQLGFRSRDTTLAILNQYLRFAIGSWEEGEDAGATFRVPWKGGGGALFDNMQEPRIIITIHPLSIWSAIPDEFQEINTAVTFWIANVILHELSHACRMAQELLLLDTAIVLRTLRAPGYRDLGITEDMIYRFAPLGIQIWGTQQLNDNYFFEEGPQSEEGKDFEAQLWGNTIVDIPLPNVSQVANLHPCLASTSWPESHVAPWLQHQSVDRSLYAPYARGGYSGFLLSPPAPVYYQKRPIEVESYAKFFRESWWQGEFQRFAHQALKIVPQRDALIMLSDPHEGLVRGQLKEELNKADYDFVMSSYEWLCNGEQCFLAAWLWEKTVALVIGRATTMRIQFEARTWHATYARIDNQINKSLNDIREIGDAINGWLADNIAGRLTDNSKQTIIASLDRAAATFVTDDLMEVSRLLRNSVQYAQALIAIYFLVPKEEERSLIHQNFMRHLRVHLGNVRNKLSTLMQRLGTFVGAISLIYAGRLEFLRPLLERLRDYIVAFQEAARISRARLEDMVALLADELVAPGLDYSRRPDALPAIPEALKRMSIIASLEKAAVRPLRFLQGVPRTRLTETVNAWLAIIARASGAQPGIAQADPLVGGNPGVLPTGLAGVAGDDSDDSESEVL